MIEQQLQTQGTVLAVHISQLTRPNLSTLAEQGYGILPDQSGWLIFVRIPDQAPGDGRQAKEEPAQGPLAAHPDAAAAELVPDAGRPTPGG